MQRTIRTDVDAPVADVYELLSDLSTYERWLDVVARAERTSSAETDAGPAWLVTLQASVGPLRRSKLLRMVRTEATRPSRLRFERAELDGRSHSTWQLEMALAGEKPCTVAVELRYEGGLWSGPLDAVLGSQVDAAIPKLRRYLGTSL